MINPQRFGTRFNNSSITSASGSTSITRAASAGRTYYITDLGASAAASTATIQIKSSGTVFWNARLGDVAYEKTFQTSIAINNGSAFTVEMDTGGNGSVSINVSGFYLE